MYGPLRWAGQDRVWASAGMTATNQRSDRRGGPWAWLLVMLAVGLAWAPGALAENSLKKLKITTQREGETTHFFVENTEATEITATFEMDLQNLKGSTNFPYTSVYQPRKVTEAFSVSPVRADTPWKYNYTSHYTLGSCTVKHDDRCVYCLPYAPGSAFRVTQGYNGTYSHTGPEQYAIDWKMSPGTPVYAARDGVVVKVKEDSDRGGPSRQFEGLANYILIRHADGTLANYAHLVKNGSQVKVGQHVRAGDLIALSGNTGFSTGPHLHFAVFRTRNGSERESIPVKFKTATDAAITLAEGHTYTSMPEVVNLADNGPARSLSPKAESIWGKLSPLQQAQGGSRKAK